MTRKFPVDAAEEALRTGGGLLSVPGFVGAGVACGIKPSGKPDVAVITADRPMHAAAMFTRCQVAAAPVVVGRAQLAANPLVKTVVVNSGNANAMTGEQGIAHAQQMVEAAEQACGGPAFVMSTGVIGQPLPVDRVLEGIRSAAGDLGPDQGDAVADAFLTTDLTRKVAATKVGPYTVGGVAKGSGMIHPDMATMLAVIATDAPVPPDRLSTILAEAVDDSFHSITVDGDTSTNDTVLLLARPSKTYPFDDPRPVEQAIRGVARSLALQIVEDGEGVSRLLDIHVVGAETSDQARRIARQIAVSSLVKTAVAGADPNWGRIAAAAGNAGVRLDQLDLYIGKHLVVAGGASTNVPRSLLEPLFAGSRVAVRLVVGEGLGSSHVVTTDLTHEYITINAEYTT